MLFDNGRICSADMFTERAAKAALLGEPVQAKIDTREPITLVHGKRRGEAPVDALVMRAREKGGLHNRQKMLRKKFLRAWRRAAL